MKRVRVNEKMRRVNCLKDTWWVRLIFTPTSQPTEMSSGRALRSRSGAAAPRAAAPAAASVPTTPAEPAAASAAPTPAPATAPEPAAAPAASAPATAPATVHEPAPDTADTAHVSVAAPATPEPAPVTADTAHVPVAVASAAPQGTALDNQDGSRGGQHVSPGPALRSNATAAGTRPTAAETEQDRQDAEDAAQLPDAVRRMPIILRLLREMEHELGLHKKTVGGVAAFMIADMGEGFFKKHFIAQVGRLVDLDDGVLARAVKVAPKVIDDLVIIVEE